MTRETLARIIANNRLHIAVHQLWVTFGRLKEENATLRAAALNLVNKNGGPISPDDTINGIGYVMVRGEDFEGIVAALEKCKL